MNLLGKPKNRKETIIQAVLGLTLIAILILGWVATKGVFGAKPGERCGEIGCGFGQVCISERCYQSCSSNDECGANRHCGATNVSVEVEHHVFFREEHDDQEHICFANAGSR